MNKEQSLLIYHLLILGVFLFITCSCKKEDEQKSALDLTTTEITDITHTNAVSGGVIIDDGDAPVTARGICWSTIRYPSINNSKTEDGTGVGSFTSSISGLEPNTTYFVRAYATNDKGTGYGDARSFTTKKGYNPIGFTDPRDGNVYKTVTIGNQVWMAENLKYLPDVSGPNSRSGTTPNYYVYGYYGTYVTDAKATVNYSTYGVLYNWPAALTACPAGWHLPSDAEWTELTNPLGEFNDVGSKLKEAGTMHWNSPNPRATNETFFTALPGGTIHVEDFILIGDGGYWWSATDSPPWNAWYRGMFSWGGYVERHPFNKMSGYSVRCVKDN